MTTKNNSASNSNKELREEFDEVKNQVNSLLSLLKEKGEEKSTDVKQKLDENLENYQDKAKEQIQQVYELGSENLDKVGTKIQNNPLASLAVAFGAGYILSKMMGKDK